MRVSTALAALCLISFSITGSGARSDSNGALVEPGVREAMSVTGQTSYLVVLKEQADLIFADRIADRSERGRAVYESLRAKARSDQAEVIGVLDSEAAAGKPVEYRRLFILNAIWVRSGEHTLEVLARRPEVAEIKVDEPLTVTRTSSEPIGDSPEAIEWQVSHIGADVIWANSFVGQGVVVATMDTGVRFTHQALEDQYRGTLGPGNYNHDYNWYDPSATCMPSDQPCDVDNFGTGLMGVIVGDDGGANQIGVAPGAKWITARPCWQSGGCPALDLLLAAEWLLAPCPVGVAPGSSSCDSDMRPHVVVIGWSGGSSQTWSLVLVNALRASGIIPLVLAGNSGPGPETITSPGTFCDIMTIGGTDANDTVTTYSSRGPGPLAACVDKPDFVAPADPIRTAGSGADNAYDGPGFGTWYGAGIAGGCVALVLSTNPSIDYFTAYHLLTTTAVDLGPPGHDFDYGHGRINCLGAWAAVETPLVFDDGFDSGNTWRWSREVPVYAYLYDAGGSDVDLSGRPGADAMCRDALIQYPHVRAGHVHAFISVNPTDEIRDMPFNYGLPTNRPIVGLGNIKIADDWADLLDGNIQTSLIAAGILTTANWWYTGSNADGSLHPNNCEGWTNPNLMFGGRYGSGQFTDDRWITNSDATCGLENYHVLCIGW